jgi:hypothetical protein
MSVIRRAIFDPRLAGYEMISPGVVCADQGGAAQPVERPVLGHLGQPGGRVAWDAVRGPARQRQQKGLLRDLLGQPDVAQEAGQPVAASLGCSIRQTASMTAVTVSPSACRGFQAFRCLLGVRTLK